jgi:histidine triad (HIT) family protein
MECLFCKIIEGKIPSVKIWENELFLAFLDINPVNPGHTLLVPKTHHDDVFDIDADEYGALFKAAKKLSVSLRKAMGSKRVGLVVEGFLVPHAHIHLIPINAENELHSHRAKRTSPDELEGIAARIKQEIKDTI